MEYAAFCITLVAVVYSLVLTEPGMLLGGLYQRLQNWTLTKYNQYPEQVFWLKPLISCALCVAGQWCFWGYLIIYHRSYNVFEHLYFTALGIFLAALLRKLYLWTKI
ncbi:hypothetical protein [Pontibacter beigongshangensis]|uniref:hypothetical protein n=1 Tax=Pontibacter beigongshangensis TaxID=2574733 RepID=UPI0016503FAA|nr:hypothetical protein [Pontibacter beigongshangensis]